MKTLIPLTTLILSACITVEAPEPARRDAGSGETCDAAPAKRLIGTKATQASGGEIQRLTGADIFQWIPPDTIVTLEFRSNRVRVTYDATMTITEITCG